MSDDRAEVVYGLLDAVDGAAADLGADLLVVSTAGVVVVGPELLIIGEQVVELAFGEFDASLPQRPFVADRSVLSDESEELDALGGGQQIVRL